MSLPFQNFRRLLNLFISCFLGITHYQYLGLYEEKCFGYKTRSRYSSLLGSHDIQVLQRVGMNEARVLPLFCTNRQMPDPPACRICFLHNFSSLIISPHQNGNRQRLIICGSRKDQGSCLSEFGN